MRKSLLILPDGTEVSSGAGKATAIQSIAYTHMVNADTDLNYGAACSAMIDVSFLDSTGSFALAAGDEIEYHKVDASGIRELVGRFILETPTKSTANTYKFTAYDRMIRLDKDVTDWLSSLDKWPYPMRELLTMVCAECGIELETDFALPNGEYLVLQFLQNVTGRQIVQWIAGANAAYATITSGGKLTFRTFADEGALNLAIKSTKLTDYETVEIQRVTVKQSKDDIGVSWPADSHGETYAVIGNPMLATLSESSLLPCVQKIAERVIGISYMPAEIQVFDPDGICKPGVYYTFMDRYGHQRRTAVFSVNTKGGISTIKSTGNASRTSSSAVTMENKVEFIQGKMLKVQADLDSVSVTVSKTEKSTETIKQEQSTISQRVDSLDTRVSVTEKDTNGLQEQYTAFSQRANSVDLAVSKLTEKVDGKADQAQVTEITEHFRFAEDGLTITNSGTGMGIGVSEKRVIFTGGEDPTTKIYPDRMETTTLDVGQRLDVGGFGLIPRTNGNLSLRYLGGDA